MARDPKRPRDRSIDIVSSNPGTIRMETRRNGALYDQSVQTVPAETSIRKRIPTGGKPTPEVEKPFLNTTITVNPVYGTMSRVNGRYEYTTSGYHRGSFNMFRGTWVADFQWPPTGTPELRGDAIPSVNSDLKSQAEVKALNSLRDASGQHDLDLGMMYAERRETVGLFKQSAEGLLNVAKGCARKDWRGVSRELRDTFGVSADPRAERRRMRAVERRLKKALKRTPTNVERAWDSMSNLVLGYNLGVSPLIRDLQSAHQLMLTGDLTAKFAVKAKGVVTRVRNDRQVNVYGASKVEVVSTLSDVHGYKVTLIAVPKRGFQAEASRWGLGNPASLLYNATTLTFLLDYFIAIGPWLSSLSVPGEFIWKEGSYSQRVSRIITTTVMSPAGKMTGSAVIRHAQRRLYTSFPKPAPPLSLKGNQLSDRAVVNTGLLSVKGLQAVLGR